MIYIGFPDGTPVCASISHLNTKPAEHWAGRNLGADWRARGYRVFYDYPPGWTEPEPQPKAPPRNVLGDCNGYRRLTDWHAG